MPKPTLIVDLKTIQDRASEAAQFLKSKIQGKMRTKGTQLLIEEARTKDIKLLLHKFLHHQGLNHYRVLSHTGTLEVTPPEKHIVHEPRSQGTPPTAPQTTPYYFPQAPVLPPARQKPKKARAKPKGKRK